MGHDPFNAPYRQSPSPNHHESPYATTSYPLHAITPPPPPPQPFQSHLQQPYPTFTPDQSFNASDLNIPNVSQPRLSHQTSTTLFQPYDDPDQDVEDMGDLPLLRAPSGRSQETLSMNMPGRYDGALQDEDGNNIRYGRIPQRVPRRYKTLKRVECVSYLSVHTRIRLAHPHLPHSLTQALPRQFCA